MAVFTRSAFFRPAPASSPLAVGLNPIAVILNPIAAALKPIASTLKVIAAASSLAWRTVEGEKYGLESRPEDS